MSGRRERGPLRDRLAGLPQPSLDRRRAVGATLAVVGVLALLVLAGAAVTATFTGQQQSMGTVDRVPTDPMAPAWEDAPAQRVTLERQRMAPPMGGGSVDNATVRTVTNATHVGIRLSWTDPTRDASLSSPRNYSDAAAVMLHGGAVPPITMGAVGTPVDIWYWRASWQFRNDSSSMTGGMYTYPHPANETKPARAVGNPLSKARYDRYAQNYYAKGYGSLSIAPVQNVRARAAREGDRWHVTFVRERSTEGRYDAGFDANEKLYMTYAVWNGSADEVNGQKSLSYTFTRLDTRSGELAKGTPAGDGGGGAATGTAADGGDDGLWVTRSVVSAVSALAGLVLVTWLVAYRRV